MSDITIPCRIAGGKMSLDRANLDRQLKALKDGSYTITIEPKGSNISHQQRKYFFGVVVQHLQAAFSEIGNACTQAEIVAFIKDKWLYREKINPISNTVIKTAISLSSRDGALTKDEFQKHKEAIQQWAAEHLHISIPDPNQNDWTE